MGMNTDFKKIIFIDDDTEMVSTYNSILEQKKLSDYLIHFENAQKGIDYLQRINKEEDLPDYILLDLYMPVMDGFQFLQYFDKIKNLKKSIEIFVCSSSQKQDDRDKVMKYPFVSAYLEKPLSTDFLELLIEDSVH
ncbi:response regulator [Draconibacterium halophilum]|uniref:Response regulator n=1 Tax=Draconibacterium halophilum TaxID=2706887 RepID=A0A6C0RFM5_9BACT|nr:response regulator [Draconibacterium halophilum]QIA09324.1 response regulator [Draconibacterium halophilum]